MSLQEKIQGDIAEAMRAKDTLKLGVLRMMKSAIMNKKVEKMKELDEPEVLTVFNTLVKQRKDSIDQFRKGGREELAGLLEGADVQAAGASAAARTTKAARDLNIEQESKGPKLSK